VKEAGKRKEKFERKKSIKRKQTSSLTSHPKVNQIEEESEK